MNGERVCRWCEKPIYYGQFCSNECFDAHYAEYRRLCKEHLVKHYKGHVPTKREKEKENRT